MSNSGSPLAMAILSVSSLDEALGFYRDVIGLDATSTKIWAGADFEHHWQVPPGSKAETVFLSAAGSPVGTIMLLEFDAPDRAWVKQQGDRAYRGLWNLNFYVDDIHAATKGLQAKGYEFWSEPVGYEVDGSSGQPIEVLFDGPDGLAINLVQLTGNSQTTIGSLKGESDALPQTRTGFSSVATTSHSIIDAESALAFYQQVCGMEVIIDAVLDKPETNHFLNRPTDARTRAIFVKGNHPYGKVALSHPLNYEAPNRVPLAVPPNIGYVAQSFYVPDIEDANATCVRLNAERFSELVSLDIPFVGTRPAMIVRNPGSGALMQLIEEI